MRSMPTAGGMLVAGLRLRKDTLPLGHIRLLG